jgi:heptosyltransferase I
MSPAPDSGGSAPSAAPQRILLVKPSSLGDVVHALPVLAGLRAAYPRAHIAWLLARPFVALLDGHPLLDEVIPFDRGHYGRMLRSPRSALAFARFLRDLRRRRFDLVIDLQGLFRSGFLALATGAPRRIGFAAARELAPLFYTQRVTCRPSPPAGDMHAIDRNLAVARALGLPVDPPRFPLALRPAELDALRARLTAAAGGPLAHFVAVIPGARWETKRWGADRLAAVLDQLHAEGFPPVVLLGGPDDAGFAAEILAHASPATAGAARTPAIISLVGQTTLRELAAAIALADLVLCHDSGPMHIAAALGKPLTAIFGPTNPSRTGPYSDTARVVQLPLGCVPCYRRRCPLGHHACLQRLDVETVLRNVRETRTAHAATPRP